MNSDVQVPEKSSDPSGVPEKYRPYSCTELTERQIRYAKKHLTETEETRNTALQRIKRFIETEFDVFSELDDNFLLLFLRSRKFDVDQTCLLMKNAAEFLQTNRGYFNRIDTDILSRVIDSKAFGFLPYRDAKGRALVLITAENWDPYELPTEDIIFGTIVAAHTTAENSANHISGYVVIMDCKSVSFRQFREAMNWIFVVLKALQYCCPISIKEIHVIHTPALILLGWSIVQPFLSEEIQKTITFYDSSYWEKLHDSIPPCILPEEVGGQLGPFSNEHWASDIPTISKSFFDRFHKTLTEINIE